MRIYTKELGMSGRLGVLKLGVFGGLLVLLMVSTVACGDAEPLPGSTPTTDGPNVSRSPNPDIELAAEGTWVLELLDGRPVIEDSAITLRIGDDWFDGINGCNRYGGQSRDGTPVVGADGVFKIPPGVAVTEMLCLEPEGVMDQADAYMSAFMQGKRFRITDDRLEILDSGDAAKLVFVKASPLPGRPVDLEGTAWRLLSEGDTMDSVRAATLVFLDDRLVTGATARRSYVATYRASEGALRFPGKSMLRSPQSWQSLGEKARTLEGEFGDFLTWAREYSVDEEGGSSLLRIWSIRGKTLTFEPLPPIVEDIRDAEWSLVAFVERRQLDPGTWGHRTTDVLDGTEVTIGFDEYGLEGLSGCNSYGGPAKLEDGSITVDAHLLDLTLAGCVDPDGVMAQEERYFALINRLLRYGINGDSLFLKTADDVFLLFQVRSAQTGDTRPPTATPTPMPVPTVARDRLEVPPQGPAVEIGRAYPYELYVHCGIRDARFDGRLWMADPMLSDGSGNPPMDWAPADSVGVMELVNNDLAVFTADSGRIIEFKPWPSDVEWRPCQ